MGPLQESMTFTIFEIYNSFYVINYNAYHKKLSHKVELSFKNLDVYKLQFT